nr:MAG TPA: hypothetical protein [Caudoviricetes sp.]
MCKHSKKEYPPQGLRPVQGAGFDKSHADLVIGFP